MVEIELKALQTLVLTALRGHNVLGYHVEKEVIQINEKELKNQLEYLLKTTGALK